MDRKVFGSSGLEGREREWASLLAAVTLGWLTFETVTGLCIYFLPFSAANQWAVIVHTAAGLALLVPYAIYQVRHLVVYWDHQLTSLKLMGWLASVATLVALVSGIVLTWQAILGTRISYAWDMGHLVSTFALIAFTAPHVLLILVRDRKLGASGGSLIATQRRAVVRASVAGALMALCVGILWGAYHGDTMNNVFPADYSWKYGKERPFAPSLARTESGGAIDSRTLSGSATCGTSGCHDEIVAEWKVSSHRWAAMDAGFQRIQEEMGKQNGAESTRYCGGCHDPISLFSGTKNIFTKNLTALAGYDEGVSCLACHSVRKTDLEGNANYIVASPSRYLFELKTGSRAALFARDFLIRAYPRQHMTDLSKRVFKTPEYCAACHKQFIDKEVNNVGWVQLQNQYDNWRKSRWNHPGDPRKTVECRECHMPLVASHDPSSGDALDYNRNPGDGKHRSHRFIAANQFMPALLKLPGAEEQIALTNKWLRGEIEIPEIADKWTRGPAVAIELVAPHESTPGQPVALKVVITSNKVGHDFPTGPLDIIQAWVELKVTDPAGNVVFTSGTVDDRHFIAPGSFMFKAEPVDQYGNLIDKHNLWEMVGVRYRRSLFPGFSDTAEYNFRCPGNADNPEEPTTGEKNFTFEAPQGTAGTELTITARLLYRKVDQYLLNFLFGEKSGLSTPVTEMAVATGKIAISRRSVTRAAARPAAVRTAPAAISKGENVVPSAGTGRAAAGQAAASRPGAVR